jgi:hypothetical protein
MDCSAHRLVLLLFLLLLLLLADISRLAEKPPCRYISRGGGRLVWGVIHE